MADGTEESCQADADDQRVLSEYVDYNCFQSRLRKTIVELVAEEQHVYTQSRPANIEFKNRTVTGKDGKVTETSPNALTMRSDIGADDSLYLRIGMSFLWAGGDKGPLFPSTLPSIRRQMEASMYETAVDTVTANLDTRLSQLTSWKDSIDKLKRDYPARAVASSTLKPFWIAIAVGANGMFAEEGHADLQAYAQLASDFEGIQREYDSNSERITREMTNLRDNIYKEYTENKDASLPNIIMPQCYDFKSATYVYDPTNIGIGLGGLINQNTIGVSVPWELVLDGEGNTLTRLQKEAVPLLYALATSNELVQWDILDYITVTVTSLGATGGALLKVDVNGVWSQDPLDQSVQITTVRVGYKPGGALSLRRTALISVLEDYKNAIIGTYSTNLEAYRDTLIKAKSNPKRQKNDAEVDSVDNAQREQRNAIWADAHREMVVSGDRLYSFIRVMAGTLNEDVTAAIHVEDRSLDAAQQEYRKQRSELVRQQRMFSQRVINDLLSSVFRSSNFRIDLSGKDSALGDQLVVFNEESLEQVRKLSETTTAGFRSTNVDLIRAFEDLQGDRLKLGDFVNKVQTILHTQNVQAQAQLARTQYQRDQNSLEYLSEPRNSFVIRMKNEAFAAIRRAFHEFRNEWDARRIQMTAPTAWDLVEGGTDDLTDAFAQYAAYLWSNSRLFSSSTAAFIGVTPAKINLIVLRTALEKLVRRAINFVRSPKSKPVPVPGPPPASSLDSAGDTGGTGGPGDTGDVFEDAAETVDGLSFGGRNEGFIGPGVVWNWG